MKAKQTKPKPQFTPIQLTLENQEEVDAIRTLVESTQITQVFPVLSEWYAQLNDYGNIVNWDKLREILKK